MSDYIVVCFANLHKSDIIGDICLNYLSDIANNYKIDEYGDVLNFSKYQVNSKSIRQKQLWSFKQNALARESKEASIKRKNESNSDPNEGTVKGLKRKLKIGAEVSNLLQQTVSDERMHLSPSIENIKKKGY